MVLLAFKNLVRRPVRSILTAVGVALGIAMLFTSFSLDRGLDQGMQRALANTGAQLLAVAKGCPYEAAALLIHGGVGGRYLDEAHLDRIRQLPGVGLAGGLFMNQLIEGDRPVIVMGMDAVGLALKPWWVVRGRPFPDPLSAILPADKAARLGLEIDDPLTLGGRSFIVTAILEPTGSQDDQFIYLPLGTAQELFGAAGKLTAVAIQLDDLQAVGEVARGVEAIPDVQAITMTQVLGTARTLMGAAQAMVRSVTIIAILVGAIGILNAIMTAIFERTREIGMMKAVGAGAGDILMLVWTESILLGLAGGLLGVTLPLAVAGAIDAAVRRAIPFTPAGDILAFSLPAAVTSLGAAIALGVAAGLPPAWRAARISPMEAIRSE
ncbi:MAG TPA: ABC transporter permease [Bacillota bacterium]|nr:ABC transporter permease [Bacillota bacterium]